jgi:hypothetical protein
MSTLFAKVTSLLASLGKVSSALLSPSQLPRSTPASAPSQPSRTISSPPMEEAPSPTHSDAAKASAIREQRLQDRESHTTVRYACGTCMAWAY